MPLKYLIKGTAILTLYLVLALNYCYSSIPSGRFAVEQYTVNEGLPHTDVNDILQDSRGFIWIATYGGLCRYDGRRLKMYRRDNSNLTSNRVISLYEDQGEILYIGTESGGMNVLDLATDEIYSLDKVNNKRSTDVDEVIFKIVEGTNGDIWSCVDNRVCRIRRSERGFVSESYTLAEREIVHDLYCLDDDNLFIASTRGAYIYNLVSRGVTMISENNSRSIVSMDGHSLYIGTGSGVVLYNHTTKDLRKINRSRIISDMLFDNEGNLWFGTTERGLYRASKEDLELGLSDTPAMFVEGLSSNTISSLYIDESGVLWVGTIGGGVNMLNLAANAIELYDESNGLSNNRIVSMAESSSEHLFVSTQAGGFDLIDRKSGAVRGIKLNGVSPRQRFVVSALYEDSRGAMWLGSWGDGVYVISSEQMSNIDHLDELTLRKVSITNDKTSIFKIIKGAGDDLWFSSANGLCHYIPSQSDYYVGRCEQFNSDSNHRQTLLSNFTTDIYFDTTTPNSTIWVGTRNGLNRISFSGDKYYTIESYLEGQFISFIYRDERGDLWTSCLGLGLYRVTNRGEERGEIEFTLYDMSSYPLPNNELESILEDDNHNLWIGGYGITKVNPQTMDIVNYTKKDGLQGNAFKIWANAKMRDGSLAFGGVAGVNVFHPNTLRINITRPRVYIVGLNIFNKRTSTQGHISSSVIANGEIVLDCDENNFEIDFAATHYVSSQDNRYKYRLVGLDKGWNYTDGTSPQCRYTNLSHGYYTFEIYGSNSDGVWSNEPALLSITIRRPFYLSYVAYLIYALLIILILWWYRASALKKSAERHQLELERSLRIEQQNNNEANLRFFTNIAHEIKTPLSLIAVPVEDLLMTPTIGQRTRNKLGVVADNIKRLRALVTQIMELRKYENNIVVLKVSQVDLSRMLAEIAGLFAPVANKRGVKFESEGLDRDVMLYIDRSNIDMVFMNIISNAFKFTPDGGSIKLSVRSMEEWVEVVVEDSGIGIDSEDLPHIFDRFFRSKGSQHYSGTGIGLALVKSIVELHRGEIEVESNIGVGSKFIVRLRRGKEHIKDEYICPDELMVLDSDDVDVDVEMVDMGVDESELGSDVLILVVEDNPQLRSYVADILSRHYRVATASNGMEAYEYTIAEQPDLIITDVVMPEMTGVELCQRVKSNEATSHISLIMLTARDVDANMMEGYDAGADAYLTKPFSMQLLRSVVKNILQRRESMRQMFKVQVKLEPSEIAVTTYDEKFLRSCLEAVEANISNPEFGVMELCGAVNVSQPQLYRKVKSITGLSPVSFIRSIRLKRAAQILEVDNSSVTDVMYAVGITNASYFTKLFKREFGCLPKSYGRKE